MGEVVDFRAAKPEQELRYTVDLYQEPGVEGTSSVIVRQLDGQPIDYAELRQCMNETHWQIAHQNPQGDDLMLTLLVHASSNVEAMWDQREFTKPSELRWLRNRLMQAYWGIDRRRGLRYAIYFLGLQIERLTSRVKGALHAHFRDQA